MPRSTLLTSAVVELALKLTDSTPPVFVKVPKVVPPVCRLLPLTVKPDCVNPSVSALMAVPDRCTDKVAPLQAPEPKSVSLAVAAAPASKVTVLPTPAQATLSPFRLVMAGAEISSLVIVPVADDMPKVALVGLLNVTVNVSSDSIVASPAIATLNVFVVSPAAKLRVPLALV